MCKGKGAATLRPAAPGSIAWMVFYENMRMVNAPAL
jgi:hypothetical protein